MSTRLSSNRCHWCGAQTFLNVAEDHPKRATVDHVRSKPECLSQKEYSDRFNKVNACYTCNQRRSAEWVARAAAGLVHPTEWSLHQAMKERERRERRKAGDAEREFLANCKPCRFIAITVPAELEAAFAFAGAET